MTTEATARSDASGTSGAPDDAFHVFDTTLRDGAQREGVNLTVADKLTIARHLDEYGVGFIEGGWPGANPRDTEFFARAPRRSTSSTRSSSPSAPPAGRAYPRRSTRRSRRWSTRERRSSRWSPRRTTGTSSWPCAPRSKRTSR